MKIAAFMVVKNDQYYIDMAMKSIMPHVGGVYVQDQCSDDGSYETVLGMNSEKIVIERVDTGISERFAKNYDEPQYRTMAVKRTEEIFKPDWILKCDADEIFTEHFFSEANRILPDMPEIEGVKVAGDRFISRNRRSIHPSAIEIAPGGEKFVDPHVQLWRAGKYYYIPNPGMKGYFHPILDPSPKPLLWLPGICNVHLHRIFGPKAFAFWAEGPEQVEPKTPFHPPTMCPRWYNSAVNMGYSEKVNFEWPDYVIEKWEKWGIW